jgi:hypothetical protein
MAQVDKAPRARQAAAAERMNLMLEGTGGDQFKVNSICFE